MMFSVKVILSLNYFIRKKSRLRSTLVPTWMLTEEVVTLGALPPEACIYLC
jgi:hypothetical protein